MRILYITPSFQHPTVRGPHRHYFFIRELSKRHEITLLALAKHEIGVDALEEMESYTQELFTFNVNGGSRSGLGDALAHVPMMGKRLRERVQISQGLSNMKEKFHDLLEKKSFDLVLFHGKSMFRVIEDFDDLPIVVDFCDATSMRIRTELRYASPLRRPWLRWRLQQVQRVENLLIHKTQYLGFVSLRDRMATASASKNSKIIPIGVDCQYWKRRAAEYAPNCIILTGVMDYGPNHDTALFLIDKIMPLLKAENPNVELLLVGRAPRAELIQKAKQVPGVTVTGSVGDLRPYLERAAVFVAPMRYASGTQNKLLEAMAMEVPVVTSKLAGDGLYVEDGGEPPVRTADTETEFAKEVLAILADHKMRAGMAQAGRAYVEKNFNWTRSAEILENLCMEAVSAK